jgi:AcrR family transcriptional regulator
MESMNKKIEVMDEAMKLFRVNGFENTSIVQICKGAKITRNTFYYYFKSKGNLLSEYLNTFMSSRSEIFTLVIAEGDDWNRYLKLYELHIRFIIDQGVEFAKMLLSSMLYGENLLIQDYFVTNEWCVPILSRCMLDGTVRNDLSSEELNAYANRLCMGITADWCGTNGDFDLFSRCKKGIELLLLK